MSFLSTFLFTISDMTLSIDNTPHDWSRLAIMLTPGSCASFIMPHEVCAEEVDDLHEHGSTRYGI